MKVYPVVSVLMTAYNRENYLAEAIESVLASSFTDFELIIVDDCSTDRTLEIARQFEAMDSRVRVHVNERNLGDYPNRNRAASYARGEYLKYLDSDDIIYSYGLEVMVNAIRSFPEAGFGLSSKVDKVKPFPVSLSPSQFYKECFSGFGHYGRAPGSSIIKKSCFDELDGFSNERMVSDMEFWLRIGRHYPMVKFPHDLYWNRMHAGQEVQTAYAARVYPVRRKQILTDALSHPDCPLSHLERNQIARKLRRAQLMSKVLTLGKKIMG